jgi:hypothetical protein
MIQIPSRNRIVLSQQALLRKIGVRNNRFATKACWACITEQGNKLPIRARITPSLDPCLPKSYFLLCLSCSQERPNDESELVQIAWIVEVSTSPSLENVSHEFLEKTGMPLISFVSQLKDSKGSENLAVYLTEKLTNEMLRTNGSRREVFLNMLLGEYAATTKRGNQDN